MKKMMKRSIAAIVFSSLAAAASASASTETKKVVAGPQYAKSGLHKMLFGADYRALWTTPATFEVLDLEREAGGLTPVARLGGMQTKILALKGKDGRNYTFRSLDKDASQILDEDLRGSIVNGVVDDAQAGAASCERGDRDRPAGGHRHPHSALETGRAPRRSGARRVPEGVRGDGGRLRRLPQRRDRVEPGLPRHHRDHRSHRDVPAAAGGRGRPGRTCRPSSRPASWTSSWATGTVTGSSGAGLDSRRAPCGSPYPRIATRPSRATTD